jgi:hypothetical protein
MLHPEIPMNAYWRCFKKLIICHPFVVQMSFYFYFYFYFYFFKLAQNKVLSYQREMKTNKFI